MRRRNEGVSAVFHHARSQYLGEGLGGHVQVAYYGVALTPAYQADGLGINPCKEQRHAKGVGSDIGLGEAKLWAGDTDNSADGGDDFVAMNDMLLQIFKD